MSKFVSIKQKFITNVMVTMAIIFLVVLAVITVMNINAANKNLAKSESFIKSSLLARGKILVQNNSIALKGLAADNAFTAVQNLVSSTVNGDPDIVRGIFTDAENHPWVNCTVDNPEGAPESFEPLSDSIDIWVKGLKEDSVFTKKFYSKALDSTGSEIIEFASPVLDEYGQVLGFIRYSLSTKSMNATIAETRADATMARNVMIFALVVIMGIAITITYFLVRSLAIKITKPIGSLVQSAKLIAQGDYSIEVVAESNDEIGKLSEDFDEMRKTIKKYTEHLQDLIDEKMQQVKDILNNIDQGLFTVNFDGTVNEEYSARANEILKVGDVSSHSVYDLLRLEDKAKKAFDNWVELVKKKHAKTRWKKLVKLAPVHEMEFASVSDGDSLEYVSVDYQKIYDKEGNLSKLMILTMDETEKRLKEIQMREERIQHENEMKTILGIANTPEDDLVSFVEDSETRINRLIEEVEKHLDGVKKQRELHPDEEHKYNLDIEEIEALYRDIHTIKGNGGSYGFDLLSERAHQAEDALEELKSPTTTRRDDILAIIEKNLEDMKELMHGIRDKMKLIYGDEDAVFVRIPEENVEYIQTLTDKIASEYKNDNIVEELKSVADKLSWKPLKSLARRFRKIALSSANKLNKEIEFTITDESKLYPQEIFRGMDEILLHVIRNAVDHGIESDEIRREAEKGIGIVTLSVDVDEDKRVITISDNGAGMSPDFIAKKAIEKGIITEDEARKLSDNEKLELIFSSGFSTASEVSEISGRGVGMDVVKNKIEELDGIIEINSEVGVGTTFKITMPM